MAAPAEPLRLLSFDLPPFVEARADGAAQGAAVEMVREIFARMQIGARLQLYPLARSLAMFDSGQADGIFTVKKTPERMAQYAFSSRPLFTQETMLFVRKDSSIRFNGDLRVLAGRVVGVVRGASYGDVFDQAAAKGVFARIESVSRDESSFRKLLAGRIDVVVSGREVGWATLRRLGAARSARVAGKPLETTGGYLMFNKGTVDVRFLRKLNATIAGMQKDGSVSRIRIKYGLQ
ncbi:transporter substrate-binding domain-containing protein [Duganella sp. sic0402]|uniref:substrate-binding periplasmic protein n=1 Tax=Duganella sp. sic0402 TaxID=2854786 RepID=UPI001C4439DC|nr:transporter substrate-binding domain-containing protein [Duganella sp. sic0402]MBV7534546.1 transporter substrate-binding domain-containing protein [Duganella sp. sic0402]